LVFLVFAITTVYSFFFDKANGKPDLYSLLSCAAFAVMSLCLSKQVHLGFEVDLLYFFCGYLTLQLMKIKLFLVGVGIIFSYFLIILRFYLSNPTESGHLGIQFQDQPSVVIQVDADSEQTNTATESAESGPNMISEDMDLGPVSTHVNLSSQKGKSDGEYISLAIVKKSQKSCNLAAPCKDRAKKHS
jgi:cell division protein FtsW (lipid II flippase)